MIITCVVSSETQAETKREAELQQVDLHKAPGTRPEWQLAAGDAVCCLASDVERRAGIHAAVSVQRSWWR